MYEETFQMTGRPFNISPKADCYISTESSDDALQTLGRIIERAEGPALLVGPSGSGKTLLCQVLAKQYRNTFRVALLACARLCSRRALLQSILFELGLPYRDMEEGELRLSLMDHLEPGPECPNGLLLLIDEAHSLPLQLLEEIRMMTNLVRDGEPRVRLVLAGGRKLEERFADPKMESFSQRLAARCYLDSLSRNETMHYVTKQLELVGAMADTIFDESAMRAIHKSTDGVPRLINQLCDHALVMASAGGRDQITARGIDEAWADLQQLPTQWSEPNEAETFVAPAQEQNTVIEFGELESDGESVVIDFAGDDSDPIPAMAVAERLDDISDQVDLAMDEPSTPEQTPVDDLAANHTEEIETAQPQPQVEVVFVQSHDPFETVYAEEEIVIDHYATLESMEMQHRPQVTSGESHEFAAALLLLQTTSSSLAASSDNAAVEVRFDPASDPVMPEYVDEVVVEVAKHVSVSPQISVSAELGNEPIAAPSAGSEVLDDRDMIIVEDQDGDAVRRSVAVPKKPRRQEYRHLFAKLRRG